VKTTDITKNQIKNSKM